MERLGRDVDSQALDSAGGVGWTRVVRGIEIGCRRRLELGRRGSRWAHPGRVASVGGAHHRAPADNLSNKPWTGTMCRVDETAEPQVVRRFDSLTSQTLSKRISRELLTSILGGEIPSGNALPSEEKLAAQFDVSRPVVREAVKELAVLGLVESRQGRATRVTPTDDWNQFAPELLAARGRVGAVDGFLLELLELRRLVETGAAGLAAARASEEDIARMNTELERMDASVDDVERFTDGDVAFHDALLAATGNHLLARLIEMLGPVLRVGRVIGLERRRDGATDAQAGHRRVLEAIRARDPEAARLAMREHLGWTADLVLDEPASRRA
jgi:DNA-binding FadR family transcriptional regulator